MSRIVHANVHVNLLLLVDGCKLTHSSTIPALTCLNAFIPWIFQRLIDANIEGASGRKERKTTCPVNAHDVRHSPNEHGHVLQPDSY